MATFRKSGKKVRAVIRRRKNGMLVIDESRTFDNMTTAKTWARARETELDTQGVSISQGLTLTVLTDRYMQKCKAAGKTFGESHHCAMNQIRETLPISDKIADKLTFADFDALIDWYVQEKQYSPATVAWHMAKISTILKANSVSVEQLNRAKAAAANVGAIGASRRREKRPTADELRSITAQFQDVDSEMLRAIWFSVYTTRRASEIGRLRWDDIDFERGRATIRNIKDPLNRASTHQYPICERALAVLADQPRTADQVFKRDGNALSTAFCRANTSAPDVNFHDFRREGISRLFEHGYDIPKVQQYSLHKTWETLRRYTILTLDEPEHVHYADLTTNRKEVA